MKNLIRIMKALSDPGRIKIMKILEDGELCVCEIQPLLGLAQPTVSKHLKLLEEAGLIEFRKEGSWIIYRLAENSESQYAAEMLKLMKQWLNDDSQIHKMLVRRPEIAVRQRCDAQ